MLNGNDESLDLGAGLITDKVPKAIFDMVVKHYGKMVKDGHLDQDDAETLLLNALINFKIGKDNKTFIQSFIQSALSQTVRNMHAKSKVGGSISTNSYNMQFNKSSGGYQEPHVMGGRKKLQSNQRSATKYDDLHEPLIEEAKNMPELDMDEIDDDLL